MQDGNLESLLSEAKKLEKKYEWLQAAAIYEKASNLVSKQRDFLRAAELDRRIGFCFYRAAFQAQSNVEFKKRLKLAIQAHEKEIKILEGGKEENKQAEIKHAMAWAVYIQSWLETSPSKKKVLLDEWWALENQALEAYERAKDFHSTGVVCNEMIEFSEYSLVFLTDYSEQVKLEKETVRLIDKTLKSLSKSDDSYELARAYGLAGEYLSRLDYVSPELTDKRSDFVQKSQDYSKKALELSLKTGNAWLIGHSYFSLATIARSYNVNFELVAEYSEKILKYGKITKDNRLLTLGTNMTTLAIMPSVEFLEDPDKQREICNKTIKLAQESIRINKIMNLMFGVLVGYFQKSWALSWLSTIETNSKNREAILANIIEINRENLKFLKEWKRLPGTSYAFLSTGLFLLAGTRSKVEKKKALVLEALSYQKKYIAYEDELFPHGWGGQSMTYYWLAYRHNELANIESNKTEKIELKKKALAYLEKSNEFLYEVSKKASQSVFGTQVIGKHNYRLGRILQDIHSLTKEKKMVSRAIEAYNTAAVTFKQTDMPTHAAESYWNMAYLLSQQGEHQEASRNYESASEAYDTAAKTIPQLKEFYGNYSGYMKAWSQIEQARFAHSIEEYEKAQQHYERAAELHESSEFWSYLAANYLAWANMEEAEGLSRSESTEQAKLTFQEALQQFTLAEEFIKQKLGEITSADEKEMIQKLLKASDLRRKYCQARILLEEAKLLDREGRYLQSARSYREASKNIERLIERVESEAERKELELLTVLCQAWEKMATAEEATSSKSYLEAATLFEQAKNRCFTRKASLWALGNSNFCKGLAAGIDYQSSLDLQDHARAKRYMKSAATSYLQAGFKNAPEYAKATQRLFDAYMYMNRAEEEADPEQTMKYYSMAEKVLQVSAGSFMKAEQPEKTAQVQKMIKTVREEKALAVSLSEVLHAPTVTSSTMSFTAPSPTNEASVGLESFEHANIQANLIAGARQVRVGESFSLTIEFVNAGKEPALLTRVEDFVPKGFTVFKKPQIYQLEGSCLNMKGKQLASLKLVEAKLILQPSKKGVYKLEPRVHYLDELGQKKIIQLKALEIEAEEVILADRLSTGTSKLNAILLGGIPEGYAVALTGAPSIERKTLVNNFLQAGTKEGQVTFYVSSDLYGVGKLLEKPSFYFFLCNLKLKDQIPDLPNVYKLHGKTDLNNLGIALVKAFRSVDLNVKAPRRICVSILSDVLVNYGVKAARKWVSELITNLSSKGFTMLAVFDAGMHPVDEANAVLGLFDGEISLYEVVDELKRRKSVRVKKLGNQDYIDNPICLTNQK